MTPKTITLLAGLLLLLAALALYTRTPSTPPTVDGLAPGDLVFPATDWNQLQSLTLTSSGIDVTLSRSTGTWLNQSLHGYPVDFPKLAAAIRDLSDLRIGQLIRGGDTLLDELSLLHETTQPEKPIEILFHFAASPTPTRMIIGSARRPREGAPLTGAGLGMGRHLRIDQGPVLLVDHMLTDWVTRPEAWINRTLLQISPDQIQSITVHHPDTPYTLTVIDGRDYHLDPLPEDQHINTLNAARLAGTLQNFFFDTLADPDLDINDPVTTTFTLADGTLITLAIGSRLDGPAQRPLRILSIQEPDTTPEDAPFRPVLPPPSHWQNWTFLLPLHQADSFTLPLTELLTPSPDDT
ncbi:MAG TPA: DUF4340 domain-containing protein [Kiritimatiellia bacterium]|nr:DUF4340 domain-containing protein [Kiritimatiellia bacterium]